MKTVAFSPLFSSRFWLLTSRRPRPSRSQRPRLRRRGVALGQIAVVGAQVLPVVRLDRGEQFLASLGLERLADINLAHSPERLFRKRAGEHHQRPGEVWTVGVPQLEEPGQDRSRLPDDGS